MHSRVIAHKPGEAALCSLWHRHFIEHLEPGSFTTIQSISTARMTFSPVIEVACV